MLGRDGFRPLSRKDKNQRHSSSAFLIQPLPDTSLYMTENLLSVSAKYTLWVTHKLDMLQTNFTELLWNSLWVLPSRFNKNVALLQYKHVTQKRIFLHVNNSRICKELISLSDHVNIASWSWRWKVFLVQLFWFIVLFKCSLATTFHI